MTLPSIGSDGLPGFTRCACVMGIVVLQPRGYQGEFGNGKTLATDFDNHEVGATASMYDQSADLCALRRYLRGALLLKLRASAALRLEGPLSETDVNDGEPKFGLLRHAVLTKVARREDGANFRHGKPKGDAATANVEK